MGIPRLTSLLQPYFVPTTIGCSNTDCRSHTQQSNPVVIDGPGLAFVVYYRLLACKPTSLSPIDAQPSYDEIGKAILVFLDGLTHCGLTMYYESYDCSVIIFAETSYSTKIYFDGYLPPHKRSVRTSRLEASLKQMITFRETHRDFQTLGHASISLSVDTKDLLRTSAPVPTKYHGLPTAPFLVPAALDSLRDSQYANLVEIVPGEADPYCAAAARTSDGILLTSDSDLLVYDLGSKGAVAFFNQVELQLCDEMRELYCLSARLAQPYEIARRLDINDLYRLAFELKADSYITVQEAVQRSQKELDPVRRIMFQDFKGEYEDFQVQTSMLQSTETDISPSSIQLLDPRVSELVLQFREAPKSTVNVYLPFLIEDPSRATAWSVSAKLRSFAYSLIASVNSQVKVRDVLEYSRKDNRIIPHDIHLDDQPCLDHFVASLNRRLANVLQRYKTKPKAIMWRVFGMIEVFSWHVESGRIVPSHKVAVKALCGSSGKTTTWQDIQLSAQLQAALYSTRILKQILAHVNARCALETAYLKLQGYLTSLPELKNLIIRPTSLGDFMSDSEISSTFDFIRSSSLVEADKANYAENHDTPIQSSERSYTDANGGDAWITVNVKHKKAKKQGKSSIENRVVSMNPQRPTNNIYGMLPNA